MMHSEYNDVWLAIVEADLPNVTKSVAMELTKWADRNTGQVNLSMTLFLTLCDGENEQAAKRHLTRLKQAGIVHYSTCGTGELNIFVTFLNWYLIPEEEVGLGQILGGEGDPQIAQISQIEEIEEVGTRIGTDCIHGFEEGNESFQEPKKSAPSAQSVDQSSSSHVAMLLEQVAALQSQVQALQGTIGLLCQRLGVEVGGQIEVKAKVEVEEVKGGAKVGEPRVGFGALGTVGAVGAPELARPRAESGAPMDGSAPEIARPRAKSGAKRRGFRREGVQQTEVCLFVNNSTTPGDLNNKQTESVTENALKVAREEESDPQITQITQIEEIQEVGTRMDTDCIHGFEEEKEAAKKSVSSVKSVSPSSLPPAIPLDERDRTFKLLTDPEIGISEREARKLAQGRGFDYTRRQVFAWQKEMAIGKVDGVGALVNRLRRGFGAPEPSRAQQESALYQRHRTAFEVEAEVKAKEVYRAMMDEQDTANSQPQPKSHPLLTPVAPEIWEQTMSRLHKEFYGNSIFTNYVQPMRLLGVHNGVHVIGVPNEQLLYHAKNYSGIVRRILGGFVDTHHVSIAFEVVKVNREKGLFKAGDYVGQMADVFGGC